MNKKVAFFAILLIMFLSFTVFAAGEKDQVNRPSQLTPIKIYPERPARSSATYHPVSGIPTEILAGKVERSKDFCNLAGTPAHMINDWFRGFEWYANYQDPEEFGCVDVWPFQVTEIHFQINVDYAMDIVVQFFVLEDMGSPDCPLPGGILCETPVYEINLPYAGWYDIFVSMGEEDICCVDNPYFAGIYIYTDLSESGADAVSADDELTCRSYNDRDAGWEDLVAIYDWPGQMMLYSVGFTSPQNDCGGEIGCCQLSPLDCVPATEEECRDLGGAWFPPPATCEDYPEGSFCTYPYPRTVIVEPNDTCFWDKNYFSGTLAIQAIDFQPISNVEYTVFEYFHDENWHLIDTDYDGTTYMRDPADPPQPGGDGWHAEWSPGSLPEGYYMIRATMVDFEGMFNSDTIVQYWDPVPPEVSIIYPDVFNFPTEGPLDIQFFTPGDNIAEMYVIVYPIPDYPVKEGVGLGKEKFDCIQGYHKGVPHFNQHGLYPDGSDGVNRGCCPTSIAACLKYWAQNGHGCLNDNGAMTDAQMVNEIAGLLGTHPDHGTDLKKEKAAIDAYIKKHCGECVFQPTVHLQGKDVTVQRLIRELFEEDEDVITGDDEHVVVANSFCLHPKRFIDYMDPWTGTEVNGPMDTKKGFDGDPLIDLIIVSPKEATEPIPPDTVAFPEDIEPVPEAPPGTYHYPWEPNPDLFPVGKGYFVNVDITDGLGHQGWDLVKVELFIRGDVTGDGIVDIGDVVYVINYLFREGDPPFPLEAGDANCDGVVDLGDVVYMLNYLFRGGPPPMCE